MPLTPTTNLNAVPLTPAGWAAGNVRWVKKVTDADYAAFSASHLVTYADGSFSLYNTIQAAVTASAERDAILVIAPDIAAGGTGPTNYAETVIIPAGKALLQIIGIQSGNRLAAQPSIKPGTGSVAAITVRSPGCLIQGLSIDGTGSTGGGILLDDDGTTKTAEGTIIRGCTMRGCVVVAGDGSGGGGVMVAATGLAPSTLIEDCRFYDCMGGVVLLGVTDGVSSGLTIRNCSFTGGANTTRDCDIWGKAAATLGVIIEGCFFGIFPNGGTKNTYMDLTGVTGLLANCRFASNGKTFGAAANVLIPTTVGIAGNYQDGALIART